VEGPKHSDGVFGFECVEVAYELAPKREGVKMKYKEFRVVILNEEDIRAILPSRTTRKGKINLDRLTKNVITVFDSMVARGKIDDREELKTFGTLLYAVLFKDDIDTEFKKAYDEVLTQQDTFLRLILEFEDKAQELAILPWEFLYYPDTDKEKGFQIATRNKLILTRYVPLSVAFPTIKPVEMPLRILASVSKPTDLGIVLADPVIEAIGKLKEQSPGAIEVVRLDNPDRRSFHQKIKEFKPHVLHFIGHGGWDEGQRAGKLALVSKDQAADWISDRDFSDYFVDYQPRLLFLHACEGAATDSYGGFRGVALQMVYSGIPAVIAMQYPITNKAAIQFAQKFYECLGQGKPVDVAVQEGRLELGMYLEDSNFSSRDFGSPVAFLQSGDAIILASREEPGSPGGAAVADKVTCPNPTCANNVRPQDRFCSKCGHELGKCPRCEKIMDETVGICSVCGYRVEKP
jgi:hypothetical protein